MNIGQRVFAQTTDPGLPSGKGTIVAKAGYDAYGDDLWTVELDSGAWVNYLSLELRPISGLDEILRLAP